MLHWSLYISHLNQRSGLFMVWVKRSFHSGCNLRGKQYCFRKRAAGALRALKWFLTSCVNLREWIPKQMHWVFILCSQLTSHSFQMSHVSVSRKNSLCNWLRQTMSSPTEQLDLPCSIPSVQTVRSPEFFCQGGPFSCCVVSEQFLRIPESVGKYWTEAIPEFIHANY